MKVNELVAGLFFLVVAGLYAAGAWSLPNPSQQPLGPSAFPLILAGLLALCAALLAWQGARASERGPALALAAALVMHSIFYLGLGVQLPWGPLEPVRW